MNRAVKTLGEAIREFLSREGLSARGAKEDFTEAWRLAAGEAISERTKVCALKRGILRIEVNSAPLLHELSAFKTKELTEAMQAHCPKAGIVALRFSAQSK